MFALMYRTVYDGSDLLGVYSSLDRAVEAAGAYEVDSGDWLAVYELVLDSAAAGDFGRRALWTSEEA
jgi:hypothetical protein